MVNCTSLRNGVICKMLTRIMKLYRNLNFSVLPVAQIVTKGNKLHAALTKQSLQDYRDMIQGLLYRL